jgi:hypothetical protein
VTRLKTCTRSQDLKNLLVFDQNIDDYSSFQEQKGKKRKVETRQTYFFFVFA